MFTHHHHQLHLPLNTFSSCVLCGSGISPPGNSLMKTFNKEAEVRTSLLSNSGKPPSSKLFLSSLQHFTDPPTLNRPVSLRPKHKHTFYKYTQPLHTSDKHWETLTVLLHKLHYVCEHQRKTLPHLSSLPQADEGHTKHSSWCFYLHKPKDQ